MEYLFVLLTFALMHFLAAASPGPNLVLVTSHSASHSRRAGLLLGLGIVCGTLVWSSSVAMGLGILIAKSPTLYSIIQYAGAIYLVWLGLGMIRDAYQNRYGQLKQTRPRERSHIGFVAKGFFVNMTNPKSIVYWTSLFSVLIPAGSPIWVFVAAILIAVSVSGSWWASVALFFSTKFIQGLFSSIRRYVDAFMGAALVLLGLRLAFSRE